MPHRHRNPLPAITLLACMAWLTAGCQNLQLTDHVWRELTTEHFIIISNSDPDHVVRLAEELERFRALAIHVTGIQPVQEHIPTKVFLFGDFGSWYEFNGGAAIMGYMWPTLRANYIVVGPGMYFMDQRHIVFHEYVHYLLRNQPGRIYPAWYDEGLAQMLSRVETTAEGWRVGSLSRERLQQVIATGSRIDPEAPQWLWDIASRTPLYGLARRWRVPIDELMGNDDVLGMQYSERLAFYAQSWGIVHMLSVGHQAGLPDRRGELESYLDQLNAGVSRRAAFDAAFTFDDAGIRRDMRRYLRKRRLPGFLVTRNQISYDTSFSQRWLSSQASARELGSLMLLYGPLRSASAHALFQQARLLDPDDGAAASGLAIALSHQDRSDATLEAALDVADEAIRLEPDNAVVHLDAGNLLLRACAFSGQHRTPRCRAHLRAAADHYRTAIELAPELPEGHAGLGVALSRLGERPDDAIRHLRTAHDMSRWLPQLSLELGRLYLRTGDTARAVRSLRDVVRWSRNIRIKQDAAAVLAQLDTAADIKAP